MADKADTRVDEAIAAMQACIDKDDSKAAMQACLDRLKAAQKNDDDYEQPKNLRDANREARQRLAKNKSDDNY